MRTATMAMVLSLFLVGGCDRDHRLHDRADGLHRWQILQQPDAAAVWRLDMATGALSYCNADFTNRLVLCMPQAVASNDANTAPAAAGTQPATGAPIYPQQPRTAAP